MPDKTQKHQRDLTLQFQSIMSGTVFLLHMSLMSLFCSLSLCHGNNNNDCFGRTKEWLFNVRIPSVYIDYSWSSYQIINVSISSPKGQNTHKHSEIMIRSCFYLKIVYVSSATQRSKKLCEADCVKTQLERSSIAVCYVNKYVFRNSEWKDNDMQDL